MTNQPAEYEIESATSELIALVQAIYHLSNIDGTLDARAWLLGLAREKADFLERWQA